MTNIQKNGQAGFLSAGKLSPQTPPGGPGLLHGCFKFLALRAFGKTRI